MISFIIINDIYVSYFTFLNILSELFLNRDFKILPEIFVKYICTSCTLAQK